MSTKSPEAEQSQDEIWEQRFQELKKQNLGGIAVRDGYTVEVYFNPFIRPGRYIDLRDEGEKKEDPPF